MVRIEIEGKTIEVYWRHVTSDRLKRREKRIERLVRTGKITRDEAEASITRVYQDAAALASRTIGEHAPIFSSLAGFTAVRLDVIHGGDKATFAGVAACSGSEAQFNAERGLTVAVNRALVLAGISGQSRGAFWKEFNANRRAWRERIQQRQ